MRRRSDKETEWDSVREKLMGLGDTSLRKSYYPELQQRVNQLQASEERFRTIFDSVNDAIFVHDAQTGAILDVNQRACELLGYARDEMLQLGIGDLSSGTHPYTMESALTLIRKAADGEPQVTDWQATHKSGRVLWMEVNMRRADIRGNERVLVVARDVTERHQAEQALRQSESRYKTVVECMPAGVVVHSDFTILFVNPAAVAAAKAKTADEMIGRPIWDFIHPSMHDVYRERYLKLLRGERQPMLMEGRLVDFDGNTIDIEGTATVIPFDGEEAILSMFRDVTQRKKAEEALRNSEERLSLTLEATTEGVYDWDIVTGKVLFSPSWFRSIGYNSSEIPDDVWGWESLIHPEDRPRIQAALRDHLEGKTNLYQQEYRLKNKDGSYKWYLDRGRVVEWDVEGHPLRMVGSDTDITEQKKAEEERMALEQHKRTFYRETIWSVTDGKLEICDAAAIDPYLLNANLVTRVSSEKEVGDARQQVEELLNASGLEESRSSDFIAGVGESITNAIKHAPEGLVYAGHQEDEVWVAVVDNGPGMESLILPQAILRRGFSTKPSMGLGYSIMLSVSDHILLKTDTSGTSVVLIKKKREPKEALCTLPDTWDSIPMPAFD